MISEFMGGRARYLQVGDVKYHLGTRGELEFGGKKVEASACERVCASSDFEG